MRDFIKEKKGTISLILVVLLFFLGAIFLFTKEGRTPDHIINVLETDESELVSRDTYQEFKKAADAYKLDEEEDKRTRNMRAFMAEIKNDNKKDKKEQDKDQKEVEDHGRNIANILPFDAKTLRKLNPESIYTSVEDGDERAALMHHIQDVGCSFTQSQLEGLAAFFEANKADISNIEEDDMRKIIQYITATDLVARQKSLKENTGFLYQLKKSLGSSIPDGFSSFMSMCGLDLTKFNEIIGGLEDQFGTWGLTSILDNVVGLMDFISGSPFLCAVGIYTMFANWKNLQLNTSYQEYKNKLLTSNIRGSYLFLGLYIVFSFIAKIFTGDLTTILAVALLIGFTYYAYSKQAKPTGDFIGPKTCLLVGSALILLGHTVSLFVNNQLGKVGYHFPARSIVFKVLSSLLYVFVEKAGVLAGASLAGLCLQILQLVIKYNNNLESVIFLNRLRRATKAMEALHKAYTPTQEQDLPYLADIAAFLDDGSTPAFELVTQDPAANWIIEHISAFCYLITGNAHRDIDQVLKDQKYKKSLESFLTLHRIKKQLDDEEVSTVGQKTADNDTQSTHPIIHTEGLRPFVPKPKAAKTASKKEENEEKEDKPSLTYDVNIGTDNRKAYLLVGDDASVMKNHLICIGQNVCYTQSMGLIRGKNKHYNAPDILFYADGYEDERAEHAERLSNMLKYAKQHPDKKMLILVSNIAGQMSGYTHAAFVHSYAAELKKLSNVTFIFSTNNVQHMYEVIDTQKVHFTLLTPRLKDQKPTGNITIGRSQGHMQKIKMLPAVARNFRQLLKRNPNYQGHLQDHVSKDYGSSILFFIFMIFMILGLMLFRKRKK